MVAILIERNFYYSLQTGESKSRRRYTCLAGISKEKPEEKKEE
jgi:hypothetical protein